MGYKFLSLLILFAGTGCFKYSFTGSLPSHIQKVAVVLFENNTSYSGVNQDLTNKVVDEFINDNTLQIVSESEADIIITGSIGSIIQRAAVVSKDADAREEVQEYQLVVNVKVKCDDVKNNKVLWQKTISQYGEMDASGSLDKQNEAIAIAIEKITEDILNNTLGYW